MPVAFVTGGTRFLGLNLIDQLLAQSWEVIVLHRFTSNLKHLRSQLFILIDRQKLPGVPPVTQNFCHVREVAKAPITVFYRG